MAPRQVPSKAGRQQRAFYLSIWDPCMKRSSRLLEKESQALKHAELQSAIRAQEALQSENDRIAVEAKIVSDLFEQLHASLECPEFFQFPMEICPFELPLFVTDFDIPSDWKVTDFTYDNIPQNFYSNHIEKPSFVEANHASCLCTPVTGCGVSCHNRLLFMECIAGDCPGCVNQNASVCTPCKNSVIQRCDYPKLEVFGTAECGRGLFAGENISANTLLIEYTGEVITSSECNGRMLEYTNEDAFYFASLGNGLMLDAKYCGSPARFANHSCNPTCELQKWNVLGETRIVLVSKKDLAIGEEICYNYQYFSDGLEGVHMRRQTCLCKAKNCSGTIGGKVSTPLGEVWTRKVSILDLKGSIHSKPKRFAVEVFQELLAQAQQFEIPQDNESLFILRTICNDTIRMTQQIDDFVKTSMTGARLASCDSAAQLLSEYPLHVKYSGSSATLSIAVKKAQVAELFILTLLDKLSHVKSEPTAAAPAQARVTWDDLIAGFKLVGDAYPVYCEHAKDLMKLLREVCNWANDYVGNCFGTALSAKSKEKPTWNSGIELAVQWYGTARDKQVVKQVTTIQHFLDDRLSTLMNGLAQRGSTLNSHLCPSWKLDTDILEILHKEKLIGKSTVETLHCYCLLPEEDGENIIMTQCTTCNEWFHPQCVNSANTSKSELSKLRLFNCPCCELSLNVLNDFCVAPVPEQVHVVRPVSTTMAKNCEDVVTQLQSEEDTKFPIDQHIDIGGLSSSTAHVSVSHRAPPNNSITCKKCKGNMSLVDIEAAISAECNLLVCSNPIWQLLKLSTKFVKSWQCRCNKFLAETRIRTLLAFMMKAEMTEPEIASTLDSQEPCWKATLKHCLQLLSELKIIRVQMPEHVLLRRVAWVLSIQPLVHVPLKLTDSMVPSLPCSSPYKPTLAELKAVIAGGLKVGCHRESHCMQQLSGLQQLANEVTSLGRLSTQKLSSAVSVDSCETVSLLAKAQYSLDLDGYFSIARLRSHVLAVCSSVKHSHSHNDIDTCGITTSGSISSLSACTTEKDREVPADDSDSDRYRDRKSALTGDMDDKDDEVYCWCRTVDDGSPMIFCDVCQVWFHCQCVGYKEKPLRNSKKRARKSGSFSKSRRTSAARREQEVDQEQQQPADDTHEDQYVCISCSDAACVSYAHMWSDPK